MENPSRGKFLLIYLLLSFWAAPGCTVIVSCDSVPIADHRVSHGETNAESTNLLHKQQLMLEALDDLVKNLTEIVSRLESRLGEAPVAKKIEDGRGLESSELVSVLEKVVEVDKRIYGAEDEIREMRDEERQSFESKTRDVDRAKGVSVTKYSPFWSEKFHFASAVKLDFKATCIYVLPLRDYEGLSKYVAVGDEKGKVYIFLRNGDVVVEFNTVTQSPITAMASYMSVYKNESFLVTGHQNGEISVLKVWEGSNGDEWSTPFMECVSTFGSTEYGSAAAITILEVHHVGRTRYILSTDVSGRIRVFRENGTIYGSVMPLSKPLAFLKQRLLFLTETGAGSLDLRTMKLRESECEGLNHSLARNYVFDAAERSKAYGFTSEGELIHVLLLGDIVNFKCRVRSKRKFDMEKPLAFQAIKGYLLAVNQEKVFVYNVSTQHYVRVGAPRLLFSASLEEVKSSFRIYQPNGVETNTRKTVPLIASDREKVIVLGLGDGFMGIYRSNLPVHRGEFSTMLWTSPVLLFIVFLFLAWHFLAKKKESLTLWGPEEPFTSTSATTGAPPMVASSGDRSYDSSSRNADMMDLRGNSLRQPRRYGSPTRYPSGAPSAFRPGSTDHNPRPPLDGSNYRNASELKFRGSGLDSGAGFANRREGLYANSQGVDGSSS